MLASGAAVAAGGAALAQQAGAGAGRARWSGWTWTRRSSTTPTTRRSMRRTSRSSASAAAPTASWCGSGWASPKRFAYGSTPIEGARGLHHQRGRMRRSRCSFTAARGASGLPRSIAMPPKMFVNAGAHYVVLDFINVDRGRRRPDADGRADPPRHRLDLQERRKLRRRSEPHLRVRPFVGRASRGRHADHRLAEAIRRAGRRHQGRAVVLGHVRSQAGAAVGASPM